jgi:hypothetical protein
MEQEWLYGTLELFKEYRVAWLELCSHPGLICPIALVVECAGARSAGNPHATCDVAGAGTRCTVWLGTHSQRKRGETDRPNLRHLAPVLDLTGQKLVPPNSTAWPCIDFKNAEI